MSNHQNELFNFKRKLGEDSAIFFGAKKGLHDSLFVHHPRLDELYLAQKATDWMHNEFDLSQDREQMRSCPGSIRDVMLLNILFQWHLDSIAADGLFPLFAPFITNSETGRLFSLNGQMEYVHALTYSEIVRQCVPRIEDIEHLREQVEAVKMRLEPLFRNLIDLKEVGAEYSLGQITAHVAYPYVLKGLVTWWCMERIQFMGSFSATFAVVSQSWFQGIGNYVQKIMLDERNIHAETMKYVIQHELSTPQGRFWWPKIAEEMRELVDNFVKAEDTWVDFLFSEGRGRGLMVTPVAFKEDVRYNAQEVYEVLFGVPSSITVPPLPYMEKWLNPDNVQNANMEVDSNNYLLNVVQADYREADLQVKFKWE